MASNLLLLLGASVVQLLIGLALGWYLCNRLLKESAPSQQVNQSLQQLQALAGTIGINAGQHASRVEAIGKELAVAQTDGVQNPTEAFMSAVSKVVEANQRLQGELSAAEKKLQDQAKKIECHVAEARTDSLTGLSNRRAFDDELGRRVAESHRLGTPLSLMLVDVDHFKKFNDEHGHQAGDEVLRGVARVLFDSVREMDMVARYGGEEFAVILPSTDASEAQRAAERARIAVAQSSFSFGDTQLHVTVSGGVTQFLPGDNQSALVKRADDALYASKAAGRNCGHLNLGGKNRPIRNPDSNDEKHPRPVDQPSAAPQAEQPPPAIEQAPPREPPPNQTAPKRQAEAPPECESHAPPSQQLDAPVVDSRTDLLTGLPSHVAFREDLRRRIAEVQRYNTPLSLVLVEIDALGGLNEEHGRYLGDVVIRAVTQFLTTAMRDTDLVARYRGSQFTLTLPGTPRNNAAMAAERVRKAIGLCKLQFKGRDIQFTICAGVSEAAACDDESSLVQRAEVALQTARKAGGNCCWVHTGTACKNADEVLAVVC